MHLHSIARAAPMIALTLLDCKCPMKCQLMSFGSCVALSSISCDHAAALLHPSARTRGKAAGADQLVVPVPHLDIILSEHALAGVVCLLHRLHRLCFADCN